jgi:hypothetical protein
MTGQKLFGIVHIRLNGIITKYRGGLKLNKGTEEKEPIIGMDKTIHGYKVSPKTQGIELEITDDGTINIPALEKATDTVIQMEFQGSNKQTWILQNAVLTSQWSTETEEGKVSLAFTGTLVQTN